MRKITGMLAAVIAVAIFASGCQGAATSSVSDAAGTTSSSATAYKNAATVEGNVQTITTKFSARSYAPITLQVGVPVRWTIELDEKDLNGCNNEMIIPKYNIDQKLSAGETVIEFTPTETGKIPYSCWMGMIRSNITVVDDLPVAEAAVPDGAAVKTRTLERVTTESPNTKVPTVAIAKMEGERAVVDMIATNFGYEPAVVIVQKGVETDFRFQVEGYSCAVDVMFPQHNTFFDLTKEPVVTVTPTENFELRCTMGMYGSSVLVVDDLAGPEVDTLVKDIAENPLNYGFQGSGGGCCGPMN